jgi:hypothetical protein
MKSQPSVDIAHNRRVVAYQLQLMLNGSLFSGVFILLLLVSTQLQMTEAHHFRLIPRTRRSLLENSGGTVPNYIAPPLKFDFYKKTCPQLPEIVEKVVAAEFAFDPTSSGPQLRLFFHDCFVQGCDASVLINSTNLNQAEKDASINFSIGNFFVIDEIKEQLEKECPGVVSCADVLALVAVYSIQAVRGISTSRLLTKYVNSKICSSFDKLCA